MWAEKFCNWTGLRRPIKVYMGGFEAKSMWGWSEFFGVVGVVGLVAGLVIRSG